MIPYSTTLCLNFELTFLLLPEKFHEHLNQNWYKWWRSFRITIFYHLIFWSTLYISMQKCKASFLCKNARQVFLMHIFYSFDFFTIVCYHCDTRSHGNLFFFFSNMHTWNKIWKNSVIWAPGHNASETL